MNDYLTTLIDVPFILESQKDQMFPETNTLFLFYTVTYLSLIGRSGYRRLLIMPTKRQKIPATSFVKKN